jgi:hypothetical protein
MKAIIATPRDFPRIRHTPLAPRFEVGQAVRLIVRPGMSARTGNVYRVSKVLPVTGNNVFQYRIADDQNGDSAGQERVTTEDNLEAIDVTHQASAATLRDSVFPPGGSS